MSKDRFTGSRIDTEELRRQISEGEREYFSPTPEVKVNIELEMRAGYADIEKKYIEEQLLLKPEIMDYPDPDYSNVQGLAPDLYGDMADKTRTEKQRDGKSWGEARKKAAIRSAREKLVRHADRVNKRHSPEDWRSKEARRIKAAAYRETFDKFPTLAYLTLKAAIPEKTNGHQERQRVLRYDPTVDIRPTNATNPPRYTK